MATNDNLNEKKIFTNTYAGIEIRTFSVNGAVWFLAVDVCKGLGLTGSTARHLKGLADFEISKVTNSDVWMPEMLKKAKIRTNGRTPLLISESGFYKLVMCARKAEAVAFQRWVCEEVLPEIRRSGSFSANPETTPAIMKDLSAKFASLDFIFVGVGEYVKNEDLTMSRDDRKAVGIIATRLCVEQNKAVRPFYYPEHLVKEKDAYIAAGLGVVPTVLAVLLTEYSRVVLLVPLSGLALLTLWIIRRIGEWRTKANGFDAASTVIEDADTGPKSLGQIMKDRIKETTKSGIIDKALKPLEEQWGKK
jgi:prophage antirepressor-like protein